MNRTIRTLFLMSIALSLMLAASSDLRAAEHKVQVVATLPNLGSIAAAVGGERIDVTVIASGTQDSHFVDPKPSFIVKLRSADLLIVNGLDLEIGWCRRSPRGRATAASSPAGPDTWTPPPASRSWRSPRA